MVIDLKGMQVFTVFLTMRFYMQGKDAAKSISLNINANYVNIIYSLFTET